MEITINGNVTINNNGAAAKGHNSERPIIDRANEVLISNKTTFRELMMILGGKPEAVEAAEHEASEREREAREEEQRRIFGKDYELINDGNNLPEKADTRPRPCELRNYVPMVARIEFPSGGYCEVYSNGYAIYDNGNRKTVVWVPDCSSATYYFGPLKDSEKEYLDQRKKLSEDDLGPLPWYHAVMIGGEDRIEYNMNHPKNKGNTSDTEKLEEWEMKNDNRWICGSHFPSPEQALMDKIDEEERRQAVRDGVKQLRKTQREAIELCYFEGMTQEEAAAKLGKTQSSVNGRLKSGKEALAKSLKKIF